MKFSSNSIFEKIIDTLIQMIQAKVEDPSSDVDFNFMSKKKIPLHIALENNSKEIG